MSDQELELTTAVVHLAARMLADHRCGREGELPFVALPAEQTPQAELLTAELQPKLEKLTEETARSLGLVDPEIGDVFEDLDQRPPGRRVVVVKFPREDKSVASHASCRNLSTGTYSRIRIDRLLNQRFYRWIRKDPSLVPTFESA